MKRAIVLFTFLFGVVASAAPPDSMQTTTPSADAPGQIATDAYIYLYPLVTMDLTRQVSTYTAKAGTSRAPINQFANHKQYPEASDHAVTAPNADTLYSTAWLDLSRGPMVFSHPDMGRRFYMFPVLDAYTNVLRTPGTRDDGGAAATYVITGPGWKGGQLPPGAEQIRSPTNMVWILGRTYSKGTPEDYDQVHALQAQYDLHPLGAPAGYEPPAGKVDRKIDEKQAVRDQVDALKPDEFFDRGARLMGQNPPAKADAPIVGRMAKIGIVPGQPFAMSRLTGEASSAIAAAPQTGQQRIKAQLKAGGATMTNGWLVLTKTGTYGTNYDQRALVAAAGLGANVPQQAVYPFTDTDGKGQKLSGKNKYVIHFAAGQLPPARAFWSITMYTPQLFFYPNPMKRYTVSPRSQLLQNNDGSVDIYVQSEKPAAAEQQANWLPAPKEGFVLMMRLYWPEETRPSILNDSWQPPAVTPISEAPRMGRMPPPRR